MSSKIKASQARKDHSKTMKKTSLLNQGLIGLSWAILFFFLGSYLITESWTWGYRGKWTNLHTYLPQKQLVFTEEELSLYDGSVPNKPIYLAIDGDVYDVTKGAGWYGRGGSYNHFAGKDAARAYVTGCFKEHLTHDIRGFSDNQLKALEHWKKFYENHHTYYKIGRVLHDPIPSDKPIPSDCRFATEQKPSNK